jgi:hypothetical protein
VPAFARIRSHFLACRQTHCCSCRLNPQDSTAPRIQCWPTTEAERAPHRDMMPLPQGPEASQTMLRLIAFNNPERSTKQRRAELRTLRPWRKPVGRLHRRVKVSYAGRRRGNQDRENSLYSEFQNARKRNNGNRKFTDRVKNTRAVRCGHGNIQVTRKTGTSGSGALPLCPHVGRSARLSCRSCQRRSAHRWNRSYTLPRSDKTSPKDLFQTIPMRYS